MASSAQALACVPSAAWRLYGIKRADACMCSVGLITYSPGGLITCSPAGLITYSPGGLITCSPAGLITYKVSLTLNLDYIRDFVAITYNGFAVDLQDRDGSIS